MSAPNGWTIDAAIYCGAELATFADQSLDTNPFPDSPGWYSLRRAWEHGFRNSEAILRERELAEHGPDYERPEAPPTLR
jgi:hypothetical protein